MTDSDTSELRRLQVQLRMARRHAHNTDAERAEMESRLHTEKAATAAANARAARAYAELVDVRAELEAARRHSEAAAKDAEGEVDRLSTDLYYALDALGYVGEMCTIVEARQEDPAAAVVSTAEVREWLKGARCVRMLAVDASLVPATRPEEDADLITNALRVQVRAALEKSGRSQASIARELQVSTKYLNQMLQGHARITLWWAARILRCCGMRLIIGEVEG